MTTAGPFFDADIARLLWKALVVHEAETNMSYLVGEDWKKVSLPKFSTNIDDAHRVVELMQSQNWTLTIRHEVDGNGSYYMAAFVKQDDKKYVYVKHETMPMAICLAALSAYSKINISKEVK